MPHTQSAKKRSKQASKRRARNRAVISDVKSALKRVLKAVKDGKAEDAKAALVVAQAKLDKNATRGYIHKNAAARHKSRLTNRVNAMQKAST